MTSLLSFQSQNMYELRNALLCLIRFLVYNLSALRRRSVKYMVSVCLQRYLRWGFFQMERRDEGKLA